MKIEIFRGLTLFGRRWYFRVRASNGEPIAQSEAYHNNGDCIETARLLRSAAFDAEIVYL